MNRLEQLADRAILEVARALGHGIHDRGHFGPCPACGEQRRSRTDSRLGPVFVVHGGKGWKCDRCKATGTAVHLVAHAVVGHLPGRGDPAWRAVLARAAEHGWCDPFDGDAPPPSPRTTPPAEPTWTPVRAPIDEVLGLWAACQPVTSDHDVAAWLRSRSLDPLAVEQLDLARALPPGTSGPAWLAPWIAARRRAVLPAWDSRGELLSLRFRAVCRVKGPKAVGPNGKADPRTRDPEGHPGSYSVAGLVLADRIALGLLRGAPSPEWDRCVVVVEGEPDFLTWATRAAPGPSRWAVLGVWSGSWTDELAARIPDGARVVVRTHHDEAGERYAAAVVRSLAGRCDVRRSRAPEAA